jgi:hypothetical protein
MDRICGRICACCIQPVVRKPCGPRYIVFSHMRVHVVYMRFHAVCMWVHAVDMRIHAVNIRVQVYNIIVEYFLLFSI